MTNSKPVPYSGKPKEFSKGEGALWWGGGGTRKATVPKLTLVLRVRSTNNRFGSLVLLTLEQDTHNNIDEERDDEDS